MTPADHITAAEQALTDAHDSQVEGFVEGTTNALLNGILHALIAIAVESGVPHQTTTTGAG